MTTAIAKTISSATTMPAIAPGTQTPRPHNNNNNNNNNEQQRMRRQNAKTMNEQKD